MCHAISIGEGKDGCTSRRPDAARLPHACEHLRRAASHDILQCSDESSSRGGFSGEHRRLFLFSPRTHPRPRSSIVTATSASRSASGPSRHRTLAPIAPPACLPRCGATGTGLILVRIGRMGQAVGGLEALDRAKWREREPWVSKRNPRGREVRVVRRMRMHSSGQSSC